MGILLPFVLIAVTILFGVLRFVVPVSGSINNADIFKDLAHIWIGILIGVATIAVFISSRKRSAEKIPAADDDTFRMRWLQAVDRKIMFAAREITAGTLIYAILPVILTVIEVVAFIVRRN